MNGVDKLYSIEQMHSQINSTGKSKEHSSIATADTISFGDFLRTRQLENSIHELKFSKHANERLASRNINLSDEQMLRLENGTKLAEQKGIRESLVMLDNMAFIVNVTNNTVITAVNSGEEKIFTNIDGAVII